MDGRWARAATSAVAAAPAARRRVDLAEVHPAADISVRPKGRRARRVGVAAPALLLLGQARRLLADEAHLRDEILTDVFLRLANLRRGVPRDNVAVPCLQERVLFLVATERLLRVVRVELRRVVILRRVLGGHDARLAALHRLGR